MEAVKQSDKPDLDAQELVDQSEHGGRKPRV